MRAQSERHLRRPVAASRALGCGRRGRATETHVSSLPHPPTSYAVERIIPAAVGRRNGQDAPPRSRLVADLGTHLSTLIAPVEQAARSRFPKSHHPVEWEANAKHAEGPDVAQTRAVEERSAWCQGLDSNQHVLWTPDPKSGASTNSATPALSETS